MYDPVEMMTLRNPLDPGRGPAPYRSIDKPGDAARQNDRGDLNEIGKNEDFIEHVLLELLEVRHHVLPNRDCFDCCLPGIDDSAANSGRRMAKRIQDFNVKLSAACFVY